MCTLRLSNRITVTSFVNRHTPSWPSPTLWSHLIVKKLKTQFSFWNLLINENDEKQEIILQYFLVQQFKWDPIYIKWHFSRLPTIFAIFHFTMTIKDKTSDSKLSLADAEKPHSFKWSEVVWRNVIIFIVLHTLAILGVMRLFVQYRIGIQLMGYFFGALNGMGITVGAHRLWCHRSFKARWPLR